MQQKKRKRGRPVGWRKPTVKSRLKAAAKLAMQIEKLEAALAKQLQAIGRG